MLSLDRPYLEEHGPYRHKWFHSNPWPYITGRCPRIDINQWIYITG